MEKNIPQSVAAFTVDGFCRAYLISKAMFYVLAKEGKGPKTFRVGRKRLVSWESAEAWRRAMEAEEEAKAKKAKAAEAEAVDADAESDGGEEDDDSSAGA